MDQKELIKEYFADTPEIVKAVITNLIKNPALIASIATKYTLNSTKIPALQIEILLILLGVEFVSKFRTNLVEELEITYDKALKISSDVSTQIFGMEVLEALKKKEIDIKRIGLREDSEDETTNLTTDTQATTALSQTIPQLKPIESEKLLPDHEEMTKMDGPHLHSQNVMPIQQSSVRNEMKPVQTNFAPVGLVPPTPSPSSSQAPQSKLVFKSIVDQKLSGAVYSSMNSAPADPKDLEKIANQREEKYRNSDPYREPVN